MHLRPVIFVFSNNLNSFKAECKLQKLSFYMRIGIWLDRKTNMAKKKKTRRGISTINNLKPFLISVMILFINFTTLFTIFFLSLHIHVILYFSLFTFCFSCYWKNCFVNQHFSFNILLFIWCNYIFIFTKWIWIHSIS